MALAIAVLIVGIWMIWSSQEAVSSGVQLVLGLAVGILALAEMWPWIQARTRRGAP